LAARAALLIPGEPAVIGPVIAADEDAARSLVAALVERAPGPCRIDVPEEHSGFVTWLAASGFVEVDRAPVMTLDGKPMPGERGRFRALASQAFG
jgi:hypothetical protein